MDETEAPRERPGMTALAFPEPDVAWGRVTMAACGDVVVIARENLPPLVARDGEVVELTPEPVAEEERRGIRPWAPSARG